VKCGSIDEGEGCRDIERSQVSGRVLGEEHPDTLTSIANLASTYWNQGHWNDAEGLDVAVKETSKREV
jgi:hypothetical protein